MGAKKARIRTKDKRLIAAVVCSVFIIFVAAGVFLDFYSVSPDQSEGLVNLASSGPRAAIVDQLSLTYPNQAFVQTATTTLEDAGYTVDYYPGENVTVDCYRNLGARNYKIVVLRVHCGHSPERQAISFFTSENYSESEYGPDQLAGYLHRVFFVYPPPDGESGYFSITPLFVKDAMKGRFNQTVIIMAGCYGLEYPSMAEAFIEKGAKAYVSWNSSVSADHSDEATLNLLRHLILEKQTIEQAVENTMEQVGEDPTYKSLLSYYP